MILTPETDIPPVDLFSYDISKTDNITMLDGHLVKHRDQNRMEVPPSIKIRVRVLEWAFELSNQTMSAWVRGERAWYKLQSPSEGYREKWETLDGFCKLSETIIKGCTRHKKGSKSYDQMAEYGFGEDDLFNNKEMLYTHVPHLEDKTKAFITQMESDSAVRKRKRTEVENYPESLQHIIKSIKEKPPILFGGKGAGPDDATMSLVLRGNFRQDVEGCVRCVHCETILNMEEQLKSSFDVENHLISDRHTILKEFSDAEVERVVRRNLVNQLRIRSVLEDVREIDDVVKKMES
ncbi:hypothetical protein PROFUN_14311 [Planoprotostelium fungivorum]|uniref:RFTS domain-containing protein n=1 Tax=Planoprotostelium fungivorum TaxID=1890364 RepID=A0A2P6N0L5_9EUKA|nr:hypothetical protein PROFUN_14311 [Planoprotostelium fungivorum]